MEASESHALHILLPSKAICCLQPSKSVFSTDYLLRGDNIYNICITMYYTCIRQTEQLHQAGAVQIIGASLTCHAGKSGIASISMHKANKCSISVSLKFSEAVVFA